MYYIVIIIFLVLIIFLLFIRIEIFKKNYRKLMQKILENERKFLQIYHNSPAMYLILNEDFKIIDCNKNFLDLLSYKIEDVIGKNIDYFVLPSYMPKMNAFKEYLMYKGVASGEFAITNPEKKEPMEIFLSATFDKKNKSVLFIMQDITKYKWMHNSLLAYAEQLKREMKKAENSNIMKTTFIANISHEMRTPLTSIIGFAELLKKTKLDNTQKDFLCTILKSSQHLLEIINDIIEISKIEAEKIDLEIEDVDLSKIIDDIIKMLSVKIKEKKLDIIVEIDPLIKDSYLRLDGFRIKQVLINLVSNAVKFTHEGYIKIIVTYNDKNVVISVEDTGIGIEKDKLDIIFEPFVQAELKLNREYEGTGLGLAISKNIVRLMNGDIKVESEKGKGSRFSVLLPREVLTDQRITYKKEYEFEKKKVAEPKIEDKSEDVVFSKSQSYKPEVLVIEDNNAIVMLLDFIFKKNLIKYISTSTGMEGLEFFKNNRDVLKLVLTDISLNDITGIDVAKEIRKIDKNIKIIGFSAYSFSEIEDKINGVFDDYIKKPFTIEEISIKMKKYLSEKSSS